MHPNGLRACPANCVSGDGVEIRRNALAVERDVYRAKISAVQLFNAYRLASPIGLLGMLPVPSQRVGSAVMVG